MKKPASFTRRDFIKQSTLASSALVFPLNSIAGGLALNENPSGKNLEVHLFSKHLQFLNYNDMAEAVAEMGFDGLDLTVRPKGHVLPERVSEDLPKAVEAINKYGLRTVMMTTNVLDSENQEQRTVLETASKFGFTHYRTGWLTYPENNTISESQAIYGQQFKNLEALNKKLRLILEVIFLGFDVKLFSYYLVLDLKCFKCKKSFLKIYFLNIQIVLSPSF